MFLFSESHVFGNWAIGIRVNLRESRGTFGNNDEVANPEPLLQVSVAEACAR
jgi:hypothetical protein